MFFAAAPIEQAVTNRRAGFAPAPEQEFFFGYGSFERTLDELERADRAHPFTAGDRFTTSDIYIGSIIGWGRGLKTLEPRPAFLDYMQKLVSRDAFQREVAIDEEHIALAATRAE